jgi:hypothetical protein
MKTGADATDIQNCRIWVGMGSASITGSATPTAHMAAFRYDTAADGTAFWRCVSNSGGAGTHEVSTTSVAVTSNTRYRFRIVCTTTTIKFYINDALVATHSTSVPSGSTGMAWFCSVTNLLAGTARKIRFGRAACRHN